MTLLGLRQTSDQPKPTLGSISEFYYFRNDRVIPAGTGWLGADDLGDLKLALRVGRPYDGLIFSRL